jgi:putative ABC transport system substrate-binding protein
MRRREAIKLLGGAAATWPLVARAQQKVPIIGLLATGSQAAWGQWTDAFAGRLRELGWIDGDTVVITYRWGEGVPERYAEAIAEFTRLKADAFAGKIGSLDREAGECAAIGAVDAE